MKLSLTACLQGVVCNKKGCGGVVFRKLQDMSSSTADQSLVPWQCDTCCDILEPVLDPSQNRPLNERPWDLIALASEKLCTALSIYKERRFKDARVLLEGFISEFSGKLVCYSEFF